MTYFTSCFTFTLTLILQQKTAGSGAPYWRRPRGPAAVASRRWSCPGGPLGTSHAPASSVVGPGVSSLMARARLDASGVGVGQIIHLGSMQISIRPDVHAEHFLL